VKKIEGLKQLGAFLDVHPHTVEAYGRLRVDRLPLWSLEGHLWAYDVFLAEWVRRQRRDPTLPKIIGWDQIAARTGIDVSLDVLHRWSRRRRDPLPVIGRGPEGRHLRIGGRVWIYESAHRDWCQRRNRPYWLTAEDNDLAQMGTLTPTDAGIVDRVPRLGGSLGTHAG
jgi:hypothetical protein